MKQKDKREREITQGARKNETKNKREREREREGDKRGEIKSGNHTHNHTKNKPGHTILIGGNIIWRVDNAMSKKHASRT
jgi:hypothetical protein